MQKGTNIKAAAIRSDDRERNFGITSRRETSRDEASATALAPLARL